MGTPIYKISDYIDWQSLSPVGAIYSGSGAAIPPTPAGGGLDGNGVAGQVAIWFDDNSLVGYEGLTYEEDSSGIGTLVIGDVAISNNIIQSVGIASDIDLIIEQKGGSILYLGNTSGGSDILEGSQIRLNASAFIVLSSDIIFLGKPESTLVEFFGQTAYNRNGIDIYISAGQIGTDGYNGGNLYLSGGFDQSSLAQHGTIYFGNPQAGYGALLPKTSETNIVYYDPATGKLSYGAGGGDGDSLWEADSLGDLYPIASGVDVYANDFILLP